MKCNLWCGHILYNPVVPMAIANINTTQSRVFCLKFAGNGNQPSCSNHAMHFLLRFYHHPFSTERLKPKYKPVNMNMTSGWSALMANMIIDGTNADSIIGLSDETTDLKAIRLLGSQSKVTHISAAVCSHLSCSINQTAANLKRDSGHK